MPEVEIIGVTNKLGQIRKTAHQYTKQAFKGSFGQVREQIIVEATWLGSSNPFVEAEVTCYIAEMMKATGQNAMVTQYNLQPFTVKVLSKERDFVRKNNEFSRFSQTENPYADLSNKIRHIYDIHMMLKDTEVAQFLNSPAFDELLTTVGKDDVISYKNNNKWLASPPADAIIFSKPEDTWNKIKTPYRTEFKDLVMGELPVEEDLVDTLKIIAKRLTKIKWNI